MIKNITKILKTSSIAKNLSILVSGTVIAQLITIGFQLLLSRLYTPSDFGAFAVYMSVVGIGITISSLRYEQAIVLPKNDEDGANLSLLSIIISFILVLMFSVVVFSFKDLFAELIGLNEAYLSWLYLLPISIFLFSVYQSLNYYLIRREKYLLSGNNKWVRRIAEGTVQSTLGYSGKGFGLILGDIVAHLLIIARTIMKLHLKLFAKDNKKGKTIIQLMIRYKEFPIKNTIPSLLNALSRLLPVIIVSRIFAADITGFFHYSRLILLIPLSLVTVSLNQVLLQQFSKKRNNKESIKNEVFGILKVLLPVSILLVTIFYYFGVDIFAFVLGDTWEQSGEYAEILVWAIALKFLISPFNASFIAFEKISISSMWQFFYFLLISSLFIVDFSQIEEFLRYYVFIEIVAFLGAGALNFFILHQYEKGLKAKI